MTQIIYLPHFKYDAEKRAWLTTEACAGPIRDVGTHEECESCHAPIPKEKL